MQLSVESSSDLGRMRTLLRPLSGSSSGRFLTHLFLPAARWGYTLDHARPTVCVRSLMNASYELACDEGRGYFDLKDIFTYSQKKNVGGLNARDLLMMHALSNLYAEGLLGTGTRFALYPSSKPDKTKEIFTDYLGPAAKMFHGWLHEDMLVRLVKAPDTSMLRKDKRHDEVSFQLQSNTVVANKELETHISGRNIVVFDDFTTSGISLEWARNLLYAAGASRVVLVTFGKFGRNHPIRHQGHAPKGIRVKPYELTTYKETHFEVHSLVMVEDDDAMRVTQEMFRRWKAKELYEPDEKR